MGGKGQEFKKRGEAPAVSLSCCLLLQAGAQVLANR